MGRNVSKLYYPVKQSVMSILPIVDEFVFALGEGDEDDTTRQQLESIKSSKLKIIDTIWDIEKYPRGMEHAHQTDIAREHCSGDWHFYLQADEVVHEKYLPAIKDRCEQLLDDREVEGLLFNYIHFYGDYAHHQNSHCWYRKEIRIIRNDPEIHSWESAQSFRRIPGFDKINYRQQKGTYKLKVADVNAYIYHYGWVRPPRLMQDKERALMINHEGREKILKKEKQHMFDQAYDYGNISKYPVFKGSHPKVMKEWISGFDWKDELRTTGPAKSLNTLKNKHEKTKYRIVSWIEKNLLFGVRLGEFKNYILLKK